MASEGELVLRLLIAGALAGLLGVERELTEQPAGMRTHILVGLGAALFAIVSAYGFQPVVSHSPRNVTVDVSRVTAGIVSGIGFLGAGAILKYGASIRGLTTAASLWVTAAVGTAVGTGQLALGAVTVGIVLLALVGLRPARELLHRRAIAGLQLVVEVDRDVDVGDVLTLIQETGVPPSRVRVVDHAPDGPVELVARLPRRVRPAEVAARLTGAQGVQSVEWS